MGYRQKTSGTISLRGYQHGGRGHVGRRVTHWSDLPLGQIKEEKNEEKKKTKKKTKRNSHVQIEAKVRRHQTIEIGSANTDTPIIKVQPVVHVVHTICWGEESNTYE